MRNVLCSGRVTPNARTAPITACTASNPTTTLTAILSSRPGARFRAASTSPNSASAPVATRVASARASYTPRRYTELPGPRGHRRPARRRCRSPPRNRRPSRRNGSGSPVARNSCGGWEPAGSAPSGFAGEVVLHQRPEDVLAGLLRAGHERHVRPQHDLQDAREQGSACTRGRRCRPWRAVAAPGQPCASPSTCRPLVMPRSTKSTNRERATEVTVTSRAAAKASS
jgi:hypothetical protein